MHEAIREAYLRYYETAYWLRDARLREERRALLEADGVVFREPLIEPVLPHEGTERLDAVCAEVGLAPEVAGHLARMVFESDASFRLRAHQATALRTSLAPPDAVERNIVVTSGTGSGKTESFLLPVLARLLEEALAASAAPALRRWWASTRGGRWEPGRSPAARPRSGP
jgi:DEAD/DEAH box helicase domain-containing protein